MITLEELQAWCNEGEGDCQEFKARTSQGGLETGCKTLCGFLNHRGGRLLFGVGPDGEINGQDVSDGTLEKIAAETRKIEPPVIPRTDRVTLPGGKQVIVVTVDRGPQKPHTFDGRAYLRRAASTESMPQDRYDAMLLERLHGTRRWENEPADEWSIQDLDEVEILRTLDEGIRRGRIDDPGTRNLSDILRGLGLIRNEVLLRAAVVLFAKENGLAGAMPQCRLRVAKFRGTDKTEFLDNRQFHGNAFRLLSLAEKFCRENLPVAGRVVPDLFERIDDPLYPPLALREALANAFCHRDYAIGGGSVSVGIYDDRLEVTSSGELHFGLTVADLRTNHESLPWNPLIAQVFYKRGLIETWGRGTLKMIELAEQAGLPDPEYECKSSAFIVRFLPSVYLPPQVVSVDLTKRQRAILQIIGRSGPISPGDLGEELAVSLGEEIPRRTIQNDLSLLRQLRLADFKGRGPSVRWTLLSSTETNDASSEPKM